MTENNTKKRIAVDVDGVLTKGDKKYWEEMCDPNQEVIDKINDLYKQGHIIIIWTGRPWKSAPKLIGFLERYGVRYHGVMMGKGSADYYIDDKAINVKKFMKEKKESMIKLREKMEEDAEKTVEEMRKTFEGDGD